MVKKIIIRRCGDCPFVRNMNLINEGKAYCCIKNIMMPELNGERPQYIIFYLKKIPKWCPLEDNKKND